MSIHGVRLVAYLSTAISTDVEQTMESLLDGKFVILEDSQT